MPSTVTNLAARSKLFEGLILPTAPKQELSPAMQKYAGDLNDYLERLAQKINTAVVNIAGTMKMHGRKQVLRNTNAGEKVYLDTRDWRGSILISKYGAQGGTYTYVETVSWYTTTGASGFVYGSKYPTASGDTLIFTTGATFGAFNVYLEAGTGKIFATSTGWTGEYHVIYAIELENKDTPVVL